MSDTTWTCQRSGDCCRSTPTVVMTWAERNAIEATKPPMRLRWVPGPRPEMTALVAGPCPLLEMDSTGHAVCTVYDARPLNCRRFGCWRPDPVTEAFVAAPPPFGCTSFLRRFHASPAVRAEARARADEAMRTWGRAMGWLQMDEGFHL